MQDAEILTRGWVFQEYLLSRRVLFFSRRAIFFECQSNNPCNELEETITDIRRDGTKETLALVNKRRLTFNNISTAFLEWHNVIKAYSFFAFI